VEISVEKAIRAKKRESLSCDFNNIILRFRKFKFRLKVMPNPLARENLQRLIKERRELKTLMLLFAVDSYF